MKSYVLGELPHNRNRRRYLPAGRQAVLLACLPQAGGAVVHCFLSRSLIFCLFCSLVSVVNVKWGTDFIFVWPFKNSCNSLCSFCIKDMTETVLCSGYIATETFAFLTFCETRQSVMVTSASVPHSLKNCAINFLKSVFNFSCRSVMPKFKEPCLPAGREATINFEHPAHNFLLCAG